MSRLSNSSDSTGEGTECFLKAASSEESEESESKTDSDDERPSVLSRSGTSTMDDRQGDGVSVDAVPGVSCQAKYQLTSIKTRMPPEQSLSGHTHVYVVTDERMGIKWLQGMRKEVIASPTTSPTKKRRYDPVRPVNGPEPPSFVLQNGTSESTSIDSGSPWRYVNVLGQDLPPLTKLVVGGATSHSNAACDQQEPPRELPVPTTPEGDVRLIAYNRENFLPAERRRRRGGRTSLRSTFTLLPRLDCPEG